MTPAPPTEDQLLIVRQIADDSGLRSRGNAIYALLADYARLKEDAARLDWALKECDVVYWWDQPKAHERSSIDIRDRAVIDAAREREGS